MLSYKWLQVFLKSNKHLKGKSNGNEDLWFSTLDFQVPQNINGWDLLKKSNVSISLAVTGFNSDVVPLLDFQTIIYVSRSLQTWKNKKSLLPI